MFDLLHSIKEIILGFFDAVGEFCSWIGSLITDLIDVLVKAGNAAKNVGIWLTDFLPAPALAVFTTILGVAVIYKFLGREG